MELVDGAMAIRLSSAWHFEALERNRRVCVCLCVSGAGNLQAKIHTYCRKSYSISGAPAVAAATEAHSIAAVFDAAL